MRSSFIVAFIFAISAGALAVGSPWAGTVTLTATCSSGFNNGTPYLGLSIMNSGNDSARNMSVLPHFSGLPSNAQSELIPVLQPNQTVNMEFQAGPLRYPGTYAGYFAAAYLQDSQGFSSYFPCTVGFNSSAHGLVYLSVSNSGGNITATVSNYYQSAVNVSVDNIVPPEFTTAPQNQTASVPADGGTERAAFRVGGPQLQNTTFVGAVEVSYVFAGTHFADVSSYKIGPGARQGGGALAWLPYTVVGGVVLILLFLVIFSAARRRGAAGGHGAEDGKTIHKHSDSDTQ